MIYRWTEDLAELCKDSGYRFNFIKRYLTKHGIPFKLISLGTYNHIFVSFGESTNNRLTKIFTAHYDVYQEGLPGANDNGAAVLQLLYYAEDLLHNPPYSKIIILFTDGEELKENQKLSTQGSYALAELILKKGIAQGNLVFFALDMCGIGDCPVWCASGISSAVIDRIVLAIKNSFAVEGFRVPFLLSDNIGFMINKSPVATISLLPYSEAKKYSGRIDEKIKRLGKEAGLEDQLRTFKETLPPSWETMHKNTDTPEKLENRSFGLIRRLLKNLSLI